MDAFAGFRRYGLGLDPDDEPLSRAEAARLDRALQGWQRTGRWEAGDDG